MNEVKKLFGGLVLAQAVLFSATSQAGLIYSNDFQSGDTAGWNTGGIATAPSGEMFLGELGNQTANLSLGGVAAHDSVTVEFDLYILRSWDGNGEFCCGPDVFSFDMNGSSLFSETFSNTSGAGNFGSFADGPNATHTATDTLGYNFYGDSSYHFSFTVADSASLISLDFTGAGLQSLGDESWGLDNVNVTTNSVPEPASLALFGLGLIGLGFARRHRS